MRRTIVLAAACSLIAAPVLAKAPVVGEPAPDFKAVDLEGHEILSSDLKGQVVILNFWATWCVPCKAELPLLNNYLALRKDAGLRIIAVTLESSVTLSKLKPLASKLSFPLMSKFKGKYGSINSIPTNFVIDRAGVLRYAKAGAFTLASMNEILVPLLNEPASPKTEPVSVPGLPQKTGN
jgi:cytochrome c biogenesis protein CcmG, thiol:disulfide interchange protein DsbE